MVERRPYVTPGGPTPGGEPNEEEQDFIITGTMIYDMKGNDQDFSLELKLDVDPSLMALLLKKRKKPLRNQPWENKEEAIVIAVDASKQMANYMELVNKALLDELLNIV